MALYATSDDVDNVFVLLQIDAMNRRWMGWGNQIEAKMTMKEDGWNDDEDG